jgi:RimJ/RimL family protein N-acetyltransferase
MHKMLIEVPDRLETARLLLRAYHPGDGPMYYAVSQNNQEHLKRFEAGNPLLGIHSVEDAESIVREFSAGWAARNCFFFGVFEKVNAQFAAQIYVGPTSWDLPEFEVGYVADRDHEGRGFVSEAVRAVLDILFGKLNAHRVTIHCSDANLRSSRVAERCGFTLEGHVRENHRDPQGGFEGELIYGLLQKDYQVAKAASI